MASITGLSRLFGNFKINLSKRIDTKLISTTNPTAYLRKSLVRKNVIKYQNKIRTEVPWFPKIPEYQREIIDTSEEDEKKFLDMANEVNTQIVTQNTGRLFAVIHICGKQYKVTDSDIIVIHGYWPPTSGDQLKLEKVLLVGNTDFTLVGRPLLNKNLVSVNATVVEKTLSHTKTNFKLRQRKQWRRIHFYRSQHTIVRINSITLNEKINESEETEEANRVY